MRNCYTLVLEYDTDRCRSHHPRWGEGESHQIETLVMESPNSARFDWNCYAVEKHTMEMTMLYNSGDEPERILGGLSFRFTGLAAPSRFAKCNTSPSEYSQAFMDVFSS